MRFRLVLVILIIFSFFGSASNPIATARQDSQITLHSGDFYFSIDGTQRFVLSRNLAAYIPQDYNLLLGWCVKGGTRIVRLAVDNRAMGGLGYTNSGAVNEEWFANWELVFEAAEAQGIYVIPVFDSWVNWNEGNDWHFNPLNVANGGPAATSAELFKADSATRTLWLLWLQNVITRWQTHPNILAWEIFSEISLTQGVTEISGVEFIEQAAAIIRAADSSQRPTTASLAEIGEWPSFYQSDAVEFINFHPFPPSSQLDRVILEQVRYYRTTYNKPVLIGASALYPGTPISDEGAITLAENAHLGLEHAIWAGMVSGAMNGRAFFWEDGYGVYFPELSWDFLQEYHALEQPAARFADPIDFAGFAPLYTQVSEQIIGGVLGNETTVIGWYRDASSEPPDWPLQDTISGQTVTIILPDSALNWHVDFYDTQTGTDIISSADVTSQENTITLTLPDFHDAIAFKLVSSTPAAATTDPIGGEWAGSITGDNSSSAGTEINLSIQPGCEVGAICGTVSMPQVNCIGDLRLTAIIDVTFIFTEENMTGAESCVSGGQELLQLQADGSLLYHYLSNTLSSSGILARP